MSTINFNINDLKEKKISYDDFCQNFLFTQMSYPAKVNIKVGNNIINKQELILNTLIIPSSSFSDKIIVFLANGGRKTCESSKEVKMMFSRWSYGSFADYNIVVIEDPMYKLFPKCTTAWYYGTKNFSILQSIGNLITCISSNSKIPFKNVIFIGSSAGGYAALYLSNIMSGTNCIAMNPQFNIPNWGSVATKFSKETNNDINDLNDIYKRNDISYISKNKNSHFYIYANLKSHIDNELQLQVLLKQLPIVPPTVAGVYTYNNFNFLLSEIDIESTHSTKFNASQLAILTEMIFSSNYNHDAALKLINEVTDYYELFDYHRYNLFYVNMLKNLELGSLQIKELKLSKLVLENSYCSLNFKYEKRGGRFHIMFITCIKPLLDQIKNEFPNCTIKDTSLKFSISNLEKKAVVKMLLSIINTYS